MQTEITESTDRAAEIIRGGGLVAFPTETVYGLGAAVFEESAVLKIFEAKQRPADNPLIAHIGNIEQIRELAASIPVSAAKLIEAFFPGPLTVVLKKTPRVPDAATAGLDTIGIRMPGDPTAAKFLRACDVPVVAPSANVSGRPSPTTWQAVLEDLDGRIDCILKGDATEIGLESTVVDCTGTVPVILRAGAVSLEKLREIVPEVELLGGTSEGIARSPGMRHRHYSPRALVKFYKTGSLKAIPGTRRAFIGLGRPEESFELIRVCDSADQYAHDLFSFFRECDRTGIDEIYCEEVDEKGIGTALMDRLRRAVED